MAAFDQRNRPVAHLIKLDDNLSPQDRLIDAVYAGALESVPWSTFMPLFRQMLNGKVVSLVLRPPAEDDAGLILNQRRALPEEGEDNEQLAPADEWPVSAYKEHFHTLDPFINLPPGQVVTMDELLPEEELLQSEFYRQYLEPAGVFHILGADTREPDGMEARLRVMRGQDETPFNEAEKQLFACVAAHMRRAIQIHALLNRMESERDLYAGAVNQLAVGTLILDETGKVLKVNEPAEHLLAEDDGFSLVKSRIQLDNRDQSEQLNTLINKVLNAVQQGEPSMVEATRIPRPSGKGDLGVIIRPVPQSAWSEGKAPAVAVFISDPQAQTSTSQDILERLFGLSKAESALALLLAKGKSLAEASEELHVSQHTARAQLKSIFAKTGVTRQAELVGLILKSVATLA